MTEDVISLAAAGRLEEAIVCARESVAATPSSSLAHEQLGSVLALAGNHEEAARTLAAAIALNPRAAGALNNFGAVLRAVGKLDEAHRYFERALDVEPAFHEALLNAMAFYFKHERYEQALRRLRAAIEAGDRSSETYDQLGLTLFRLGLPEEAIDAFQTAIATDPDAANAWANLANVRMESGDLPGARAAIEEAIRLNPHRPDYYRYLTSTTRSKPAPQHVEALRALSGDPSLQPNARAELQYALGDIAASESRWHEAFEHYVEANRISRSRQSYDESATLDQLEQIAGVFTKDVIARGAVAYSESDRPVFIFGMPRSGTTLVEQIIASHPDVFAGGELTLLDAAVEKIFTQPGPISAAVATLYEAGIQEIAPSAAARVTDKMPLNYRYAGLIRMVFPRARMIHLRRDPLDTCWSCFSTSFTEGIPWTCNLAELGRYYRSYAKLMDHWREALPPGSMLEVQYEDLVADLETNARGIIAYCGLSWNDRCLTFHETKRIVRTASSSQVRKPLYSQSVGRSRAYGELLRPLADALGVDL